MAAAMGRPGRFRHRFRVRHESGEDTVRLDFDREPSENVKEILRYVVLQQGVSKGKKLAYLNSFVKLIRRQGEKSFGLESIEILACLQIGLLHEAKEVRAAVLRVLRHLLQSEDMLCAFLALHMDYLVVRCLDVCLDNEIERIHAIRLIRQINTVAPKQMPHSLVYSIIAVGNDGACERDRFVRICLATLCEITLCNVDLVGKCGGISTLLWNILDSHQYPRLNESLTCTLMYLLNHPRSRHYIKANTDLETLLAPLTDSQFHFGGESSAEEKHQQAARREDLESKAREERETRFVASKLSLITLMHTWPGLIRLCHPKGSGIQSLIGILYLPYIEIRKHILEMISDAFRLTLPEWTEDFASALISVDPMETKDLWKLTEGFVAEEGRVLLPHCASTRPNLIDNHIALLLSAWINAGLLEALVEVITSSEGPLFNRSIILLGEMLHMASVLLPAECYSHSHCLPVLLTVASSSTISTPQRHRACMAVKHLSEFHGLKKRGLVPSSLFLDQLLQHAGKFSETTSRHWYLRRDKLCDYYYRKIPNDDNTQHAVRDSQVNNTKENFNWDWDLIGSILKWPDDRLRKMEDMIYIRFLRRVVFFFKPTNHLFSHMEINSERGPSVCQVACQLVDFLVSLSQEEVQRLTSELLADINHCLNEVVLNHVVPESVFGSQSLHNTLCMYYFLMIGRFSATKSGCVHLEKAGIFQSLMEMMTQSAQDMHVRLAISALNYSMDGSARVVLSKALTATSESCRLYSTKFLRVLLRAGTRNFSSWGMELLVTQLYDQSSAVTSSALSILDEACDIEANLLQLIKVRPSVLHLGDGGVMLLCRFLSVPVGFRSLRDANYIPSEMERWHKTYNARYVTIVEELLNEALTSHEKSTYGGLTRRSILKGPNKDVFLPTHLYGQLALHEEGMELLKKEPCLQDYFAIIHNQYLVEDTDILRLKEALWAVGHVGSSAHGVSLLEEENIVPELIRLAEECGVFSIRGTAFYVLGLVASTRRGADVLAEYGWESKCHTRRELWPVLDEHGWRTASLQEPFSMADQSSNKQPGRAEAGRLPSVGSTQLSFIKEETARGDQSGEGAAAGFFGTGGFGGRLDLTIGENRVHSSTSIHSDSSDILTGVPRSRTLPSESGDFRRYQTLPARSLSERHIHRRGLPLTHLIRSLDERSTSTDTDVVIPDPVTTDAIMIRVEGAGEDFPSSDTCEVTPSPVIRLRADSVEEPASPELSDSKGKEPMFQIGSVSGSSSSGGQKEDRSSSESSQRSKGRADSFNTDSTTSGVSSCESGTMPAVTSAVSSLSPIPSSSSINTISTSAPITHGHPVSVSAGAKNSRDIIHPSTAHRKRWNLTRIPSTRRRSQSPALGSLQSLPGSRSSSSFFTSHRDVWGYATLRNIRRKRTYSADADPDSTNSHDSSTAESRITRTVSVESDASVDSNIWLSIRRNVSSASLADHEQQSQQLAGSTLTSFKPLSLHNRFVGLTLPVDVNMMFEVIEGEDTRSSVFKQQSPEETLAEQLSECKVSVPQHVPPLKKEGTFEHNSDICLLCTGPRQHCFKSGNMPKGQEDIPQIDAETETVGRKDSDADSMGPGERDVRLRGGSMNEQVSSATPGSQTSSASSDSASKRLTEDSVEGRRLIRMEILRLITNLSSSVGLKGSEQGLLSLKQRFPSTFKDVCFFSEICSLMSSLAFRLNARRFIQELFDEIDITKFVEGPYSFLGIKDDDVTHMAPIRQDSMDSFADFS